jgi:hypothetical protein
MWINKIRYKLIEWLVGDMPVMINFIIFRPKNYDGALVSLPMIGKPGMFMKNKLMCKKEKPYILIPRRDHEEGVL